MRLCARWGPSSPPLKGAHGPMSIVAKRLDASGYHLVMEVGLGPGDIVLDGDPAPPKGAQPPNF